ncbi:hypothetical protein [Streptomyces sp. NPDC054834]
MPAANPRFSVLPEDFAADPYRSFARLREQAPVHYEPAVNSYFLPRYQHVKRVLTDHETFTTETLQEHAEPVMRGPVLAQMTGAEHTAKRHRADPVSGRTLAPRRPAGRTAPCRVDHQAALDGDELTHLRPPGPERPAQPPTLVTRCEQPEFSRRLPGR